TAPQGRACARTVVLEVGGDDFAVLTIGQPAQVHQVNGDLNRADAAVAQRELADAGVITSKLSSALGTLGNRSTHARFPVGVALVAVVHRAIDAQAVLFLGDVLFSEENRVAQ